MVILDETFHNQIFSQVLNFLINSVDRFVLLANNIIKYCEIKIGKTAFFVFRFKWKSGWWEKEKSYLLLMAFGWSSLTWWFASSAFVKTIRPTEYCWWEPEIVVKCISCGFFSCYWCYQIGKDLFWQEYRYNYWQAICINLLKF